jgi:RHS repeat-associated protein
MYSVQNVRSRFTTDPVPNNTADHLVAVRYDATASAWQYNVGSGVNSGWRNFVPNSTDRLLGEMNSATQTATTFRGQSTVIFGVNAGYAVGDLDIEAFRYNGAASSGNLSVTGTYFATRAGTTSYTWDTRGRLTGATTVDTSSRVIAQTVYQYDVQDRRIGRTENSEGVIVDRDRYLYQGEHVAAVASDSDGDGNYRITDRYLHSMATDAVLSMVSSAEATGASLNAPTTASLTSAELLWTLTDHLGSVRDVVSAGGSIVRQHINYDAFGNRVGEVHRSSSGALINGDSAAAVDALFGYAGREWDDSIDLQYNRARWYDPVTGRFISQDPIAFEAGDANLYRYVGNGPTNATDPSGLEPDEIIPKRQPNDEQAVKPVLLPGGPYFPNDIDVQGLRVGLGVWLPSDFFEHSKMEPEQTRYGCGGMMAMRAGLAPNVPMSLMRVRGGVGFARLSDALEYLHGTLEGKGLVVALQQRYPYRTVDEQFVPDGGTVSGRYIGPIRDVDILTTGNFCTLQGSDDAWYWEDGTGPWANGGKIRHYQSDERGLRSAFGTVMFVVVPDTPTQSPNPAPLRNRANDGD